MGMEGQLRVKYFRRQQLKATWVLDFKITDGSFIFSSWFELVGSKELLLKETRNPCLKGNNDKADGSQSFSKGKQIIACWHARFNPLPGKVEGRLS